MFSRLFTTFVWECLYRYIQDVDAYEPSRSKEPFLKMNMDTRYWCADPFIVQENGKYYIFCEMMDLKTSHGVLGCSEVKKGQNCTVKPIMDFGCHVSYPNVFKADRTWYMIPETSGRCTIELYRAVHFPDKWEKTAVLATNIHAVDTTVFKWQKKWYAFIYQPQGENNTLSIAELDLTAKCLKQMKSVKHYADQLGRPAGNVFLYKGQWIRPTQYGVNTYGGKIIFKAFSFDPEKWIYDEKDVSELAPETFAAWTSGKKPLGCHTYNYEGGLEIIDIKYQNFSLLRPFRILMKYFRLRGYSFYAQK